MKTAAILLLLLSLLMLVGFGLVYLMGFAMSFDAPGSDKDPSAWGMRLLMFSPALIFLVAIILAVVSYQAGNYKRSLLFGLVSPVLGLLLFGLVAISSFTSLYAYKKKMAREAEDARLYPVQKFLRPAAGGTDTIIIFPSRIVAYRLYQADQPFPWGGPLGDLNETRDAIIYQESHDNRVPRSELDQFVDEKGRKLTDVYQIR